MSTPPTQKTIGRYKIVEQIGQGGMGSLYLAHDPVIDRLVAIKVLREGFDNDELRERFAREARAAGRLRHPNIVTIFDVGEHEGQPFIAMEYLPGETIAELIRRRVKLPVWRKLKLLEDVCEGLAYAHKAGLVHRDVKPANVMVDPDGTLKILDFGIVRLAESGMTQAGMLVGTLNYMSPEQVCGAPVDSRSDIFAVGAVAYELITYKQAFPGTLRDGILHRIMHEAPPPLDSLVPDIDPAVPPILDRALEKNVAARYQDLTSLRKDLQRARERLETEIEEEPPESDADAETKVIGRRDVSKPARPLTGRDGMAKRRAELIERHIETAQAALESGDHQAAIAAAEQALLLDAGNRPANDLFDRAQAAAEAHELQALLAAAREELQQGQPTKASVLVDQVLARRPDLREASELKGTIQERRREEERARERAMVVRTTVERARASLAAEAYEAASRAADEVLALQPEHMDARTIKDQARAGIAARLQQEEEERHREELERLEQERIATEAQRRKEEEARRQAEEEAQRQEETRRQQEEEKERQRQADAVRKQAEAEARRREAEEQQRRQAARVEAARLEAARLEAERLEGERQAAEARRQKEEEERRQQEEAARRKAEDEARRLEAGRLEAVRLEAARLEAVRLEAARLEAARLEAARLDAERLEAERLQAERLEAERLTEERRAAEARQQKEEEERQAAEARRQKEEEERRRQAETARQKALEQQRAEEKRRAEEERRAEQTRRKAAEQQAFEARRQEERERRETQERLAREAEVSPLPAPVEQLPQPLEPSASPGAARPSRTRGVYIGAAAAVLVTIGIGMWALRDSRSNGDTVAVPPNTATNARAGVEKPATDPVRPAPPPTADPTDNAKPSEPVAGPPVAGPPAAPAADTTAERLEQQLAPLRLRVRQQLGRGQAPQALAAADAVLRLKPDDKETRDLLGRMTRDAVVTVGTAKGEADKEGAPNRAPVTYQRASALVDTAQKAQGAGRLTEAVRSYWSARDQFARAAQESRDVAAAAAAQQRQEDEARTAAEARNKQLQPQPKVDPAPPPTSPPAARPTESAPVRTDPPPAARTDPPKVDPTAAITQTLRAYEAAWASLNPEAVRRVHALSGNEFGRVRAAMDAAREVKVSVQNPAIVLTPDGQRATVTASVRRTVSPKSLARGSDDTRQAVFTMEKRGGSWMIVELR